ncbi:hypothetical protein OROGR_024675 [Orobanche gracilis]
MELGSSVPVPTRPMEIWSTCQYFIRIGGCQKEASAAGLATTLCFVNIEICFSRVGFTYDRVVFGNFSSEVS